MPSFPPPRVRLHVPVLTLAVALALSGCAHQPLRRRVAVDINRRPTPVQPDSNGARGREPRAVVMSAHTLRATIAEIAQDTLAARTTLDRCAGHRLLPDQEGVFDSTTGLLMQVRQYLAVVDLKRAYSLARQARQLATSLGCR